MELSGKRIALGVTGGIAAYKAAELVRLLIKQGATVQVAMSEAATRFVTPVTFQALSGRQRSRRVTSGALEEDAVGGAAPFAGGIGGKVG